MVERAAEETSEPEDAAFAHGSAGRLAPAWWEPAEGEPEPEPWLSPDAALDRFLDWTTARGIELWSHQEEALMDLMVGDHVILGTPTGSGKSLVALGMQKHNIVVCDSKGVIYKGREPNMAETKAAYAVEDSGKRTLDDVIDGADIFLGCSGPKVLTQEMVKKMARAPMILALANPEPEILPPLAKEVRSTPLFVPAAPTIRTR